MINIYVKGNKVILFKSYHASTHADTHTQQNDCMTCTTKWSLINTHIYVAPLGREFRGGNSHRL